MTRSIIEELEDMETPPDRLRELYRLGLVGPQLERITKHPSTPLEILLQTAEQHPRELLQNPIFPLLLLEAPELALRWPAKTIQALLSVVDAPQIVVECASRHPSERVRAAVASSPAVTSELLWILSQDKHGLVLGSVSSNQKTSPEALDRLASHQGSYIRALVAKNPNTTEETLHKLAKDTDWQIRSAVVAHPNVSDASLALLAADSVKTIRGAVSLHQRAPRALIALMSLLEGERDHPLTEEQEQTLLKAGPYACLLLARRPSTRSAELLEIVSTQPICEEDVAMHPNAPPEALAKIASTYRTKTRVKVALHPATTRETLRALLLDREPEVRDTASRHPSTPQELLDLLRRAGADAQLKGIQSARPLTESDLQTLFSVGGFAHDLLVRHPDASAPLLFALAKKGSSHLDAIALHKNAPFEALQVALDYAPKEVAQHQNAGALLEALATNKLRGVRYSVAKNPTTPEKVLSILAQDTCREVRYEAARHTNVSALMCEQFARDADWLLRRAAARHPTTTLSTLYQLSQDQDPRVRRTAEALYQRRSKAGSAL